MHTTRRLVLAALATALLSACSLMQAPDGLDLSLSKSSAASLYRVSLQPPPKAAAINEIHAWEIVITTQDGVPVNDARFVFSGGMPQHGHGFPTDPRVTDKLGAGRYVLDGVKFSMSGWWQMKLKIDAAAGSDQVAFNTVVGGGK